MFFVLSQCLSNIKSNNKFEISAVKITDWSAMVSKQESNQKNIYI